MAELLVKAEKHWMDDLTQSQVDDLTMRMKDDYDCRTQIGDIIVVKPDGWGWGKEECLPRFIIIKLPGIEVSTVEHFVKALNQEEECTRIFEVEKEVWDIDNLKNSFVNKIGFTTTPKIILTKTNSYLVSGNIIQHKMLKRHKYMIPEKWVLDKVLDGNSFIEMKNAAAKQTLIDSVLEKIN